VTHWLFSNHVLFVSLVCSCQS